MALEQYEFEKMREKVKAYYDSVKYVYSPYFKEAIAFTSKGFMHLIYEGSRKERNRREQYFRLKSLKNGVEMLKVTTVVQEYEERIANRKMIKFWGFVGIIKGHKIKVVVRQKGNGKKHFYSIFPKWKTRKSVEK